MAEYSFLANDPSGADSYSAMEMRRRIALQMLAQKRAYPKNIGEGLASVGESIGDIGVMRAMERQIAALDAQRKAEVAKAEGGDAAAAVPPPAVAGPRADVVPDQAPVRMASAPPVDLPPEPPAPAPAAPVPVAPPARSAAAAEPLPIVRVDPATGRIKGNVSDPYVPTPAPPDLPGAQSGTPEQGARLAASFDQFQPGPAGSTQPLYSGADALAERRLSEVTGMGGGTSGSFSYAPTASMGRAGDVMSDAPPVTGMSARMGQAVGDTVQSRRDDIARTLRDQTAPVVPQENPTSSAALPPTSLGSPPEASGNRPIATDIPAGPVAPGVQTAQAKLPPDDRMPPAVPPTGTPARPVPPAPTVGRETPSKPVPPTIPAIEPKSRTQLEDERKARTADDPYLRQFYADRAAKAETARAAVDARRLKEFESERTLYDQQMLKWQEFQNTKPERELQLRKSEEEAQKRDYEEKITRRLGGVPQDVYIRGLDKSYETVKGIPASQQSINKARALVNDNKMFAGWTADINTSLKKMMETAGFPRDPRASGTEQFRAYMGNVVAQARQALVGGANISNADLAAAERMAGGDAKLQPETILAALDAAERINLQTALAHQKKVRRFAGEDDPDRQGAIFDAYGVPGFESVIPQRSIDKLRAGINDPEIHRQFDDAYHTPGLSRRILQYRR